MFGSLIMGISSVVLLGSGDRATEQRAATVAELRALDWCQTQQVFESRGIQGYVVERGRCPVMGDCDLPEVRNQHFVDGETVFKTIRVRIHVFREDDGSNPAATEADVLGMIEELDINYAPWHINFECTWGWVDDTTYRYGQNINGMKSAYAIDPATICNVYVVALSYSFGTFPWDPNALGAQGGIVFAEGFFTDYPDSLTHEMGHNLGLWHTHHGVSEVTECGDCYESPVFTSSTVGDFCSDTPPTPINGECGPPGGNDPCTGWPWGPTQPENFMSYGGLEPPCWSLFTAQQAARMHCWIESSLTGWLVCTSELDCNKNLIPDDCDEIGPGDFDADGIVGLLDFADMSELISGPDETVVVPEPGCEPAVLSAFDWDEDSDIDLRDLREFQLAVGV